MSELLKKQLSPLVKSARPLQFFYLALGVFFLFAEMGCTTTSRPYEFHPLYANIQFTDEAWKTLFREIYRRDHIYRDYRPLLIADAVFKNQAYRKRLVADLSQAHFWNDTQAQRVEQQQQEAFQNRFEFIVFLYNGTVESVKLDQADSAWKMYLKDDDGDVLQPLHVVKLKETHREVQYLKKYTHHLDRWVDVYRVSFPKLSKATLQEARGSENIQLVVSGLKGQAVLQWEDLTLFY